MVLTGASRGLGRLLAHGFSQAGAGWPWCPAPRPTSRASPRSCRGRRSSTAATWPTRRSTRRWPTPPWRSGAASTCGSATRDLAHRGRSDRDRPGDLAPGAGGEPHRRLPRRPRRRPGHGRGRAADLHRLGARRAPGAGPVGLQRLEGRPGGPGQGPGARPGARWDHGERRRPPAGSTRRWPTGGRPTPSCRPPCSGTPPRSDGAPPPTWPAPTSSWRPDASAFVTGAVLTVDGGYLLV